jgi:pilus assembly protein CpaF
VSDQAQFNRWQEFQRTPGAQRQLQLEELRQRVHQYVIEQLGPLLTDTRLSDTETRKQVHEHVHKALAEEESALSGAERAQLVQDVTDDVMGYGPIDRLIKEHGTTEVMCNGPKHIFVEREGKILKTDVEFVDATHLRRVIDKIVAQVGRRIDESTPMVDARLPDGSRVNAVVHPIAIGGPFLTIRKFAETPYTIADLINFDTVSAQVAHFLDACVRGRLNIVISGGTGSGKTTMLNVASSFIPGDERIVTVEDAKELRLLQEHVLSMESRPANIEGVGEVKIRDLVRNALRMRPDRIVVGEVRGAEALDMLQAMNTGHDGSLTTVHSNAPRDTLARIETMTLMAGMDLPIRAIREQMASALDAIVHVARLRDGTRRVTHVSEVLGMEGDTIVLQDIYLFDFGMGLDEDGKFRGHLKSTGIRPTFSERLSDHGIHLAPELFTLEPFARRVVGLR